TDMGASLMSPALSRYPEPAAKSSKPQAQEGARAQPEPGDLVNDVVGCEKELVRRQGQRAGDEPRQPERAGEVHLARHAHPYARPDPTAREARAAAEAPPRHTPQIEIKT